MTKKEILTMSRNENRGRADERELQIYANASKFGMKIGCLMALVIMLFAIIIKNTVLLYSSFAVYFAMLAGRSWYTFAYTKDRKALVRGIFISLLPAIDLIILVIKGLEK